jgi:1,4-dihydroxy-2-naphthoyl-CoA hydrolase
MGHTITLDRVKEIFIKQQLPETFGVDISKVEAESVTGLLTVDERHLRPGNIMNGGVSLVLIETLGSISSCLFIDLEKENAFGIQVSANHLGMARRGDVLTATTKSVHIGKTTHVWDVTIKKQDNKLICSGRITMMVMKR